MIEVALVPIPNSVNFPGAPCPLHVFEPRYRKMARHCLKNHLPMGVCHTEKVLHAPDNDQSLEKALHTNQSTYKPCDIFSAGPVTLLEELEDGRMAVEEFSFSVMGQLGMDANLKQEMLEMTEPTKRLERALAILNTI